MKIKQFVFLDIGFTLVGGPNKGPVRRLIDLLNFSDQDKNILAHILFCEPHEEADSLASSIADQLGGKRNHILPICRQLWQQQIEEIVPLPGAKEWFDQLAAAGIGYGFISNIWHPFFVGFEHIFGQECRNRPCFLSYKIGYAKPNPQMFAHALQQVGMEAKQTVMIGDTYEADIKPAQALGMKTIWLLHRPDKEMASLLQILNGFEQSPHLTLATIGQLKQEQMVGVFGNNKKGKH